MSDINTIVAHINKKSENEMFDVKREYYHKNKKYSLIKDVVAFANSSLIGDKFIVFNIDNDTFQLSSMNMNTLPDISDINKLLREYCEPNITVELSKFYYNGGQVAYLKISGSNLDYPYMMKRDFVFDGKTKLHQGQIYIRRGATNFIANRSDLDILVDMRVSRTIKIETQSIKQKQIVVDRQTMSMYSSPFLFKNAAKTNYLIKSAKIILSTLKNVFSIDVSFIANFDTQSVNSQDLLSIALFDIAANSTVQKYILFSITPECNDILMQSEGKIRATLILVDVNNNEIVSNTEFWGIEND